MHGTGKQLFSQEGRTCFTIHMKVVKWWRYGDEEYGGYYLREKERRWAEQLMYLNCCLLEIKLSFLLPAPAAMEAWNRHDVKRSVAYEGVAVFIQDETTIVKNSNLVRKIFLGWIEIEGRKEKSIDWCIWLVIWKNWDLHYECVASVVISFSRVLNK